MRSILDKISYHAVYDTSILEALRYARENGFAGIQVAVELPHLALDRLPAAEKRAISRYRTEHDLHIGVHAPDYAVSLWQTDRDLNEGQFTYLTRLITASVEIGARILTVHPGVMPAFPADTPEGTRLPDDDRAELVSVFAANLNRLIELNAGRMEICVENYHLNDDAMVALQPYLSSEKVSLCWDVAKSYRSDGTVDDRQYAYMRDNLSHIRQAHLHDIREGRSHRVIGTGCVDWPRFLSALSNAPLEDCCIEVRLREKALESKDNLARMLRAG